MDMMQKVGDILKENTELRKKLERAVEALKKIEDPRLREHTHKDAYTDRGCIMNIATECLKEIGEE